MTIRLVRFTYPSLALFSQPTVGDFGRVVVAVTTTGEELIAAVSGVTVQVGAAPVSEVRVTGVPAIEVPATGAPVRSLVILVPFAAPLESGEGGPRPTERCHCHCHCCHPERAT